MVRTLEVLALRFIPGLGDRSLVKLQHTALPDEPFLPPRAEEWYRSRLITRQAHEALNEKPIVERALIRARRELERAEELGISIIPYSDQRFPHLLRLIPNPPAVLYVKGNFPSFEPAIAIVGTREPTDFGVKVARLVSEEVARRGWWVVSGLANGIDSEAHRRTLSVGGKTVAVLANGLDSVYPKNNEPLAEEIVAAGGALLSENPLGTRASARNLVDRDRLQSGLSVGTVVCETDIRGGSMHTARFTLDQKRLLFCPVPKGSYREQPKSQGLLYWLEERRTARPIDGRQQIPRLVDECAELWETLREKGSNLHGNRQAVLMPAPERDVSPFKAAFLTPAFTRKSTVDPTTSEVPESAVPSQLQLCKHGELELSYDPGRAYYILRLPGSTQSSPDSRAEEKVTPSGTRVRLLYDEKGLLVGIEITPPRPR